MCFSENMIGDRYRFKTKLVGACANNVDSHPLRMPAVLGVDMQIVI